MERVRERYLIQVGMAAKPLAETFVQRFSAAKTAGSRCPLQDMILAFALPKQYSEGRCEFQYDTWNSQGVFVIMSSGLLFDDD